jgi:hypothetical protein
MRLRCDTVAPVAAEHFDERFGSNSRELAQLRHLSVAILALADIPDLLGHPATVRAKPVGTMKIYSVRLRQMRRPYFALSDFIAASTSSASRLRC